MSAILKFLKALAGIPETKPLKQELWQVEGNKVRVRIDEARALGESSACFYLTGNGLEDPILVVTDDEGSFHGFSNRCTHFGRKLDPVPGKRILRCCSVNHSTFDYHGNRLAGPAKRPIKVYPIELKDGELIIST
ncbi:MAG: ubiquinol-cytochrome c reductase iron-sulfur subunit [Desulfomonilaceae bacterium]